MQKLINTYKLLEKMEPPDGQEFCIYAYILYSEKKDGVHGKQIYLGAYPTKKKALSKVQEIIKKTGHDCIYVSETCHWADIDEVIRPDRTIYSDPLSKDEDLERLYREKILRETEKEEERTLISQELEEQVTKELDSTTVEHYAHNWFNAIKNKASIEYHKQQLKYYEEHYNKRVEKIQKQYQNNPTVEEEWLNIYEQRLKQRKEEDIFIMMKEGHDLLIKDILLN
jgi:hypothetical protein